jgi:purine nucleosidase
MKKILLIFLGLAFLISCFAQKRKVWIDADTGNEMDDLYAIARIVMDTTVDIAGISSAHFNNVELLTEKKWHIYPTKNINTVQISQDLNEKLLKYLNKMNIPHPLWAAKMIGHAWGETGPRDSPAARAIIKKAHECKFGEKLDIISIGAVTNLASAIILDSSIVPKIRCYLLAARFDPANNSWNKNEFNVRNDLNAFDFILNKENLELFIMPANIARPLQFTRQDCKSKLNSTDNKLFKLLLNRWDEINAGQTWVMWDLALIEAYLLHDAAMYETRDTPGENRKRNISVYTGINEKKMLQDFWSVLLQSN